MDIRSSERRISARLFSVRMHVWEFAFSVFLLLLGGLVISILPVTFGMTALILGGMLWGIATYDMRKGSP